MNLVRTQPIIAVFGSSSDNSEETLSLADRFGQAISAHGAILLTGGTGPADEPVKNRAIKGALKLSTGCWVGVDRHARLSRLSAGDGTSLGG